MLLRPYLGVIVRVAVIICGLLAGKASWWAAVDPRHNSLLLIFLWFGVAFAWRALIPVAGRAGQILHEVTYEAQ